MIRRQGIIGGPRSHKVPKPRPRTVVVPAKEEKIEEVKVVVIEPEPEPESEPIPPPIEETLEVLEPDDGLVECKVCGKRYKSITYTHLKTHKMTMDEYEAIGASELAQ